MHPDEIVPRWGRPPSIDHKISDKSQPDFRPLLHCNLRPLKGVDPTPFTIVAFKVWSPLYYVDWCFSGVGSPLLLMLLRCGPPPYVLFIRCHNINQQYGTTSILHCFYLTQNHLSQPIMFYYLNNIVREMQLCLFCVKEQNRLNSMQTIRATAFHFFVVTWLNLIFILYLSCSLYIWTISY